MNIKILGSKCAISDDYMEAVESAAKSIGLEYSIQKITDEEEMEAYGVSVSCMYGYCPGCNFNHEEEEGKYTPALIANEKLLYHSNFPMDDVFIRLLGEAAK